jgi:hypothetical protein
MKDLKRKKLIDADAKAIPASLADNKPFERLLEKQLEKKKMRKFLLKQTIDKSARRELKHLLND